MAIPTLGDVYPGVRSVLGDTVIFNGVVNVSGTAVTWVSGSKFGINWPSGTTITLNNVNYLISSISSGTSLTISSSGGTQNGIPYSVSIGQIFTDRFLLPYANLAFQEMFTRLQSASASRVQRTAYFMVGVNQTVVYPASIGILNLGQVVDLWERGSPQSAFISAISISVAGSGQAAIQIQNNVELTLSSSISTLTSGLVAPATLLVELANISGISDDINDQWGAQIVDDTHLMILGCAATGVYSGTGGIVLYSPEQEWSGPLVPKTTTDDFPTSGNSMLEMYNFQRGVIKFPPVTNNREVKLSYTLSSSIPATATPSYSLGIDDCTNFMIARTAHRAATAKKMTTQATEQSGAADYFLSILLSSAGRALQVAEPVIPAPYREKRNIRPFAY